MASQFRAGPLSFFPVCVISDRRGELPSLIVFALDFVKHVLRCVLDRGHNSRKSWIISVSGALLFFTWSTSIKELVHGAPQVAPCGQSQVDLGARFQRHVWTHIAHHPQCCVTRGDLSHSQTPARRSETGLRRNQSKAPTVSVCQGSRCVVVAAVSCPDRTFLWFIAHCRHAQETTCGHVRFSFQTATIFGWSVVAAHMPTTF